MSEPTPSRPPPAPDERPWTPYGPALLRIVLALGLFVIAMVLVFTLGINGADEEEESGPAVPEQRPGSHETVPRPAVAAPVDRPQVSDQAELDAWSERVAEATGLPERAVTAYGRAEMWLRGEQPGCRLSWATLAGIGRVESRHGGMGGGIGADGTPERPIIGVALDGSSGVRELPDTDGGRLDGDRRWDRAVGPMQFLPETWQRWGDRATGDGAPADPQNVDDAALAAGRYLCSLDGDLTTPQGWWDAVLTYNNSVDYGQQVYSGADAYAVQVPPGDAPR